MGERVNAWMDAQTDALACTQLVMSWKALLVVLLLWMDILACHFCKAWSWQFQLIPPECIF